MTDEDGALPKKWNLKYTLRNHFDAVRQMQFHPVRTDFIALEKKMFGRGQ